MNRWEEDKAKEILEKVTWLDDETQILPDKSWHPCDELTSKQVRGIIMDAMTEMAEWMKERMTEKSSEWLNKHALDYFDYDEMTTDTWFCDGFIDDFKKAMIEE